MKKISHPQNVCHRMVRWKVCHQMVRWKVCHQMVRWKVCHQMVRWKVCHQMVRWKVCHQMVRWKVCHQMVRWKVCRQMARWKVCRQMESVSSDVLMENQEAAADGAAWQSLPPYFTIASSTACDKSVSIHTGIVAGALPLPVTSRSSGTSFSTLKRIKIY